MGLGSDSISLLFKARGDTDDAKKAFHDLRDVVSDFGKGGLAGLAQSFGVSSKAADGLTSALGPTGIAIGAVAASVTAAVGAATGLTVALFKLAESSAEFGSQIHDASDKTGLTAETISSLKVAADQSSSSLEAVTGGLAKFAKTI